ncbi:MAG: YncE family protein [Methylocella sp.]
MKRNAIHWGLLALSLLCGGALHLEATSTARAGASNTPWGTIIATLPATAGSPFAINPKTNAVYSVSSDGKAILVLDGTTNQVTAQIPIPGGVNGTWFDARQDRLYVLDTTSSTSSAVVIDAKTNSIINTISLVQPQGSVPNMTFIAVNSATGKLYGGYDLESVRIGPGLLAVWDLATGALIESVSIDFPADAAINPKTNRLYVTDNFSSQLVVVDGVTNQVIDRIQTGQAYFPDGCYVPGPCITQASSPFGVSISEKTNRLYVIDIEDGTLYVIDGNTDRVIGGPVPLGGPGAGSYQNAILDDVHDVLYIPTVGNGPASVIALDLKTLKPIGAPIIVGAAFEPPGCYFAPAFNCTTFGDVGGAGPLNPVNHTIYASGAANYVIQINSMKHEDQEALK